MSKDKKSKNKERDIFMMSEEDAKNARNEVSISGSGLLCPKTNKRIGGECKVCDYIQTEIYPKWPGKENQDHPARKWAGKKKAKLNWFTCAVFPENPNKLILLELGSKAGNQIIDGMEKQGWKDILHPHKNIGRMMKCTKKKGDSGYPEYTVSPDLEKADWDVPESVWKNVPDLRDIISIIQNGELDKYNHQKISSLLKMDETISFRLLPPKELTGDDRKFWISGVYRHWGVTKDQIEGNVPLNWREVEKEDTEGGQMPDAPDTFNSSDNLDMELPSKSERTEKKKRPSCFGKIQFFDDGEPDPKTGDVDRSCIDECEFFKECGKAVAKSQ